LSIALLPFTARAQSPFRKLGELELRLTGLSAVANPATVTVPKNTASGVRISIQSGSTALSASEAARLLGGSFVIDAEFSGPGLRAPLHLPQQPLASGDDPFLLNIPAVSQAGDYSLSNLRVTVNGATRWMAAGSLQFQPSELAKPLVVLFLASQLSQKEGRINELVSTLLPLGTVIVLVCGLILLEPDFGTALTILMVSATLLFVAGLSWKKIALFTIGLVPLAIALILSAD